MSSLRINHQSRVAAGGGGETGRAEASASDGGFAVALGAAGGIRQASSDASSGMTNGSGESAGALRKRAGSPGGDAAALAGQGTLVVPGQPIFTDVEAAAAAVETGTIDDRSKNTSTLIGEILDIADEASAGPAVRGTLVGPANGQPAFAFAGTSAGAEDPAALDASAAGSRQPPVVAGAAPGGPRRDQPAEDAPGSAGQLSGSLDPSRLSPPAAAATGAMSNVAPVLRNASVGDAGHDPAIPLVSLPTGLPPVASGQMGTGTGEDTFGAGNRTRFAPIAASSETAGAAAAPQESSASPIIVGVPGAVPGKEGDLAGAGTVSAQVAGQVVRMLSIGSQEAVLRLHPPELGEVTVRVAVSGRDVAAWFGSLEPHVQTAIGAGMGQLQADLGNAGYNLNGAWVGADTSGADRQGASPRQPTNRPPPAAFGRPLSGVGALQPASGVNIYV